MVRKLERGEILLPFLSIGKTREKLGQKPVVFVFYFVFVFVLLLLFFFKYIFGS